MAKMMWLIVGKEYESLGLPLVLVPFLFTFLIFMSCIIVLVWVFFAVWFFFSWVINRLLLKIWIGGKTLWFLEFKDITYIFLIGSGGYSDITIIGNDVGTFHPLFLLTSFIFQFWIIFTSEFWSCFCFHWVLVILSSFVHKWTLLQYWN